MGGVPFDALLESEPVAPPVELGPEIDSSPNQAQIERAIKFLREVLAEGPLPSALVTRAGKAQGLPERTLTRARSRLHVKWFHSGGYGRGTCRYMSLPQDPVVALRKRKTPAAREEVRQRLAEARQRFEEWLARDCIVSVGAERNSHVIPTS